MELASRRMDSMRAKTIRGKRQEQLKNIKPQLDLIAWRLKALANEQQEQLESKGSGDASETSNSIVKKLKVHASAHRRTITLTPHCCLNWMQARRYLVVHGAQSNSGTRPVQLTEFVRRMNEREECL
jgi:hypothetical protein